MRNAIPVLALVLTFAAESLMAANLIQTNAFEDGQAVTNYVMDSHFLRVAVSPSRGGA